MTHAIYSTTHALDRFSAGGRMESLLLAPLAGAAERPERPLLGAIGFAQGGDDEGWPGQSCGVRPPYPYETRLSFEEVAHGVRHQLFGETK